MRALTVLGSSGAYPLPGEACSGFLIEWDGFRLVLDLGYGTLSRLLLHSPASAVDAVVITHEHPDHCIDLHGLFRIRHYEPGAGHGMPLYCPPGVLSRLGGLEPEIDLQTVFDVYDLPGSHQVGPFRLTGVSLPHFVTTVGVRLETATTALAYTGDTGPDPALADLGRDADLFVVESTDRPHETEQVSRNLLTASEAGYWASQAGARRLLLTHF